MQMSNDDFDMSMPTERLVWDMRLQSPLYASAKLSQRFDQASKCAKGSAFLRTKVQARKDQPLCAPSRHQGVAITPMTNEAGAS